jgi:hypothetical protein
MMSIPLTMEISPTLTIFPKKMMTRSSNRQVPLYSF